MAENSNNPEVYVDKKPLTPEDVGKVVFKGGTARGNLQGWYQNSGNCPEHLRDGVVILDRSRHYYACCCSFLS